MPPNDDGDTLTDSATGPDADPGSTVTGDLETIVDQDAGTVTFAPQEPLADGETTTAWLTVDANTVVDLTDTI